MTKIYPAIIIATYNRPHALQRLLGAIARADYSCYHDIPLIISIDGGGNPECTQIAESFKWIYGEKRIIIHKHNLGLKQHILSCGDLTQQYGAIIMLEEDTFVSPYFYDYTVQTISYYQEENKIAGVSLFFLKNNELTDLPFWPMANGADVFFAQVPSSWGQTWTGKQWYKFRQWLETHDNQPVSDKLPDKVQLWPSDSSWKKFFFSYMADNDLYFVLPYVSYATNMGDCGEHFNEPTLLFQTCLMEYPTQLKLLPFSKENVVYDAYFELLPETYKGLGILQGYDFEVDLAGAKPLSHITKPYILSTKQCTEPVLSFDLCLTPAEINVIEHIDGDLVHFALYEHFIDGQSEQVQHRLRQLYNEITCRAEYRIGYSEATRIIKTTRNYRLGRIILSPIRRCYLYIKKYYISKTQCNFLS